MHTTHTTHTMLSRDLSALLGRTRAAVLEAIADGGNTTAVAERLGVSPASASEHAAVLREAGLITSVRVRNCVQHTLTPLGAALLGLPGPARGRGPHSAGINRARRGDADRPEPGGSERACPAGNERQRPAGVDRARPAGGRRVRAGVTR